jgi:hypothetical protein
MQGWDLRTFYDPLRPGVLAGWMVTGVFAGVVLPALVAAGGFSGVLMCHDCCLFAMHMRTCCMNLPG